MPIKTRIRSVARPTIQTGTDLRTYVVRVAILCVMLAVAIDVVNQLTFFIDWTSTLRSWFVSAVVAGVISVPVAYAIGRSHLDLYRAKLVVEELSRTDPLTGLLNRRALLGAPDDEKPGIMVLVIADIDRFKGVNDSYGHLIGDEVIKIVGRAMQSELGVFGPVGRIGGEEFALVAGTTERDKLLASLWNFRDRIASTPIVAGAASIKVTVSIGMATRRPAQSFADLFVEADRALYLAKAAGRNRVVAADDVQHEPTAEAHEPALPGTRRFRNAG